MYIRINKVVLSILQIFAHRFSDNEPSFTVTRALSKIPCDISCSVNVISGHFQRIEFKKEKKNM